MNRSSNGWLVILLLAGGITASAVPQQAEAQQTGGSTIRLKTARFWRGEGRTLLEGIVGVPVAQATRNVNLEVRDSTGKALYTETWIDSASAQAAALAAMNAETTTPLEMVLNPGLYVVAIRESEGSIADSALTQVRGFDGAPVISDVVVSANMRVLAANEQPSSAEMQRGRYAIERSTRTTLLPADPKLWYYLELYRQGADSVAQLEFRVTPEGKNTPLARVQRNVAVGARGTVDAAALPVQGLPPGNYTLTVVAKSGTHQEERTAQFTMGSFAALPPVAPAAASAGGASESNLFARYFAPDVASDAVINGLLDAMTVGTPGPPIRADMLTMNAEGKRRFLAQYWSKLPDPNPATATHEMLDEYSSRVKYVEAEFKEKGGRSGVKTDRGRIYLRYGVPDVTQLVSIPTSNRRVILWKYTQHKALKYAFLDETGFEHFNLVFSTDPNEPGTSDWEDRVADADAISQIKSF